MKQRSILENPTVTASKFDTRFRFHPIRIEIFFKISPNEKSRSKYLINFLEKIKLKNAFQVVRKISLLAKIVSSYRMANR